MKEDEKDDDNKKGEEENMKEKTAQNKNKRGV